ncbi:MAG: HAD family hydrolase [Deltaproteobacteria bacterium]|nr:HAD family hydrolase [Deltaproteobacteria bacterium]
MSFEALIQRYSKPLDAVPTTCTRKGKPGFGARAVLFDIYGTLFISKAGDIGVAKQEADTSMKEIAALFQRYGVKEDARSVLEKFFDEIQGEKDRLRKKGVEYPEVVIEDIWEKVLKINDGEKMRCLAVEYELIVNPVYPMPNLKEMLSGCRRRQVLMGIISNAQFYTPHLFSALLDGTLEDLGFKNDLLFFSYRLGYGKPSIDVFESAARELEREGVPRDKALYVGNDMRKDICPAKEAGFQAALFAGDARSLNLRENDARCEGIDPDIVITDLLQILDYL